VLQPFFQKRTQRLRVLSVWPLPSIHLGLRHPARQRAVDLRRRASKLHPASNEVSTSATSSGREARPDQVVVRQGAGAAVSRRPVSVTPLLAGRPHTVSQCISRSEWRTSAADARKSAAVAPSPRPPGRFEARRCALSSECIMASPAISRSIGSFFAADLAPYGSSSQTVAAYSWSQPAQLGMHRYRCGRDARQRVTHRLSGTHSALCDRWL